MGTFLKYPELATLPRRPEILAVKEVIATEKLHGTNFRVFFPAGIGSASEVRFGGRNEVFAADSDGFYGGRPVRWFRDQPGLLERMVGVVRERGYSDVTVFGEACGAGIQKGVRYVADDRVVFRAFDLAIGENLVTWDLFVELCDRAELPRVPVVWRGEPSKEAFDALLERPSLEAGRNGVEGVPNTMEGVVVRSTPLLRNVFGEWLIVKHKCESFAEARAPRERPGIDVAPVEAFARTFVVRGRVVNALGRLRDAGHEVGGGMQDMRLLVPAVIADLHKECEAEWQAVVATGCSDGDMRGAAGRVLAVVYRRLLEEAV